LNPAIIENRVDAPGEPQGIVVFLARVFPFLKKLRTLVLLQQRHQELLEEDRGILEKQLFRSGFMQGYNACMSSVRFDAARR
jgi:hypothetical protein